MEHNSEKEKLKEQEIELKESSADEAGESKIEIVPELPDGYELIEKLGEGGMGRVYRVRDLSLDKEFAIKILQQDLSKDASALKRFNQEIDAAAALSHANLISIYKHGTTDNGEPYLVMDYLEGPSLAELIEKGTDFAGNADRLLDIFIQICEALAHAHENGVIHRDIKPSNIIITKAADGKDLVKIVDFGIARVCSKTGVVCPTTSNMLKALCKTSAGLTDEQKDELQRLTQPGEIFGSPLYMSPEQCQGEEADCRSEVYSLGCMMFEALTGKPPLKGSNAMDTLILRINEDAPLINTVDPELRFPEALEKVVAKALARYPDQRYQEVHELTAALEEAMAS